MSAFVFILTEAKLQKIQNSSLKSAKNSRHRDELIGSKYCGYI